MLYPTGLPNDLDFCRQMLESVEAPSFLLMNSSGRDFIVNRKLINLLKYKSAEEFYNKIDNLFTIFDPLHVHKFRTRLDEMQPDDLIKKYPYRFLNTKHVTLHCMVGMKCLIKYDSRIWFGYVKLKDATTVRMDRSIATFFNKDKFIDETMIIMDFKGNILATNRELNMINFFADFTDKKTNLFSCIAPSYHDKLNKRIEELKKGNIIPPSEYVLAGNNEKSAYIEVYSTPVVYRKRKAILTLIRDITVRKETEKNLLYTIVNTEEKERQRFSRDLHDELGPFLSGLKLYLHELQVPGTTNEQRKIMIGYLSEMTDEAVERVRMIASNMAPQNMIEMGLTESVNTMIFKLNQTGRINIKLTSKGNEGKLEPSFIITLYRIILELINNSIKHSESTHIRIRLDYKKKFTSVKYTDNGKGFDLKKELRNNKGIGLKSILSRITLYQGNYKFTRVNPSGIGFEMNFPVK